MEGVDYSFSRPNPAALKGAGKHFAVRYVGTPHSDKNLTRTEAAALLTVGIDLVAVYETTAGFMLQENGVEAAERAFTNAWNLGMPRTRPIYFALDVNPSTFTDSQWSRCYGFLQAARHWVGGPYVGVYGNDVAIDRLVGPMGPTTYGWQTYAWSGGLWSSKAQLQQYRNGVGLAGGLVDLCRSTVPDFGQWSFASSPQPIPAPQPKETNMRIIDCKGSPALLVRGDGSFRALNNDERNAWRAGGVEAFLVTKAQRDIIVAHYIPIHAEQLSEAIADAVVAKLPANPANIPVESLIKAAVRDVIAEARFDIVGQAGVALDD
jgi:hypothetical protein